MTEENRIIYTLTMQVRKSKLITINHYHQSLQNGALEAQKESNMGGITILLTLAPMYDRYYGAFDAMNWFFMT